MRKIIWAPWRIEYIEKAKSGEKEECFLCRAWEKGDALVVYKGKSTFVIMNKYPYNSGHIMVCPKSHVAELEDIPTEEKMELLELLEVSIRALRKAIKPHGFNIGINMGRAAGAGLEDHIHIHVVPRWIGDTNFMPICSDVKIIVEDINSSMMKIKNYLTEAISAEKNSVEKSEHNP
jgi:ATP adenylyltransferase